MVRVLSPQFHYLSPVRNPSCVITIERSVPRILARGVSKCRNVLTLQQLPPSSQHLFRCLGTLIKATESGTVPIGGTQAAWIPEMSLGSGPTATDFPIAGATYHHRLCCSLNWLCHCDMHSNLCELILDSLAASSFRSKQPAQLGFTWTRISAPR